MNDMKQDEFEQRVHALLQEKAEQLDGRTRSRLTQARHAALDAIKKTQASRTKVWYWLMPATGAAAAVLAVTLSIHPAHRSEQASVHASVGAADELEIVTAEDSLDFYRDVEFYAWLDTVLDEEPAEANGA